VRSYFTWRGDETLRLSFILQVFIMGDGLLNYKAGPGFDKQGHSGETDLYLAAGREVSYGFFNEDQEFKQFFNYEGINFYSTADQRLQPGQRVTFTRYVAVTGGGVDPVLRAYRSWDGDSPSGKVMGVVSSAVDGTPVGSARVHVLVAGGERAGDHVNQAVADETGHYELALPAGDYLLVPFVDGYPIATGVPVTVTTNEDTVLDLTLPAAGQVTYSVTDPQGEPLPARIIFRRDGGREVPSPTFGERVWHRDAQ